MSEAQTLEQRVITLERQNRNFRIVVGAMFAVAAGFLLIAQTAETNVPRNRQVIEVAEAFIDAILDGNDYFDLDARRGRWIVSPDGSAEVFLVGKNGVEDVSLRFNPLDKSITVIDSRLAGGVAQTAETNVPRKRQVIEAAEAFIDAILDGNDYFDLDARRGRWIVSPDGSAEVFLVGKNGVEDVSLRFNPLDKSITVIDSRLPRGAW